MNIHSNDPRLTAFALGELDDAERAELDALLSEREDLRAEVEAIRAVAGDLRDELSHEPALQLSDHQRESIKARAESGGGLRLAGEGQRTIRPAAWWWRIGLSGAAAVLLLGVFVPLIMRGGSDDGMLVHRRGEQGATEGRSAGLRGGAGAEQAPAGAESPQDKLTDALELRDEMTRTRRDFGVPAESTAPESAAGFVPEATLYTIVEGNSPLSKSEARGVRRVDAGSAPDGSPARAASGRIALRRSNDVPRDADMRSRPGTLGRAAAEKEAEVRPALGVQDPGLALQEILEYSDGEARPWGRDWADNDSFAPIEDNPFLGVVNAPLSTFSIDVDTASYSIVRRQLREGRRPSPDSVRLEEMINYFDYQYDAPSPGDAHPFRANVEIASCPWRPEHRLVRIGLKGMEIPRDNRPATNLVFLLDVSGSMNEPSKLPLVKEGLKRLVESLTVDDRVAIVVYAGASGLVLDSTYVSEKETILGALDRLNAGGSTNGGAGIELAYAVAQQHFIKDGVNRVILATDGDFNVGVTNRGDLIRLAEEKAKTGVFLTALGFGMGNLKDDTIEQIANKGNGMYAYIDTIEEAQKVLVDQLSGSLVTIAKDVKIQVEFNPAIVKSYRLLGYENRMLAAQDFNDDTKDAGEIGAGHTVTALYEVQLAGDEDNLAGAEAAEQDAGAQAGEGDTPEVDPLRYQQPAQLTKVAQSSGEMLTVKVRYKKPDGDVSTLVEFPTRDEGKAWDQASHDFRFAASVAVLGMILRDSPHKGSATLADVQAWAETGLGDDRFGYRRAFIEMARQAQQVMGVRQD